MNQAVFINSSKEISYYRLIMIMKGGRSKSTIDLIDLYQFKSGYMQPIIFFLVFTLYTNQKNET